MSGASASASASSGSSSLGSSHSSLGGGLISYGGSSAVSPYTAQANSSPSRPYISMLTTAPFDLSQLSFSSQTGPRDRIEDLKMGSDVVEMFSPLALTARSTLSFQERSQSVAYSNKASENGTASLGIEMLSRSTSETLGSGRNGRTGTVLAEEDQQKPKAKNSQGKDIRSQERYAPREASAVGLDGYSFSAELGQWRRERQAEFAEKSAGENKEQDPKSPDDKEERLTQYYRRVLDSLIESRIITEDMASPARSKRGNDLVAAIGVVLSQAEEQKTLASRRRIQEMERQLQRS
jgi:hypothetical protein